MAGIYIHIPFCAKNCHYCDFYKTVNTKLTDEFVIALLVEIDLQKKFFSEGTVIKTVYFGGGTPSLLTPGQIEKVFEKLHANFIIANNAEITFEANPDDLTIEYILVIKALGVNRLSIGIQSFHDSDLQLMNRRHSASQALDSVEIAIKAGITNLSIDLIYGLPGMTEHDWHQNLQTALQLPITHLSAYHLIIEHGTVFHSWHKNGKIRELPDDLSWKQFQMLNEYSVNAGFEHYEISSLCKPGLESKHNTSYWKAIPYLGLGPSAHSFNGVTRQWNVANINEYIECLQCKNSISESETLTNKDKANEYIMTGLRTAKGIDLDYYKQHFGEKYYGQLQKSISYLSDNDIIIENETILRLTLKGWFSSDRIIRDLMVADD